MADRRLRVVPAVLLITLLIGPSVVTVASGAPPPRPVCAACGDAFEERAAESGVQLTVTDSTATVTVHDNGTLRRQIADARYWDAELRSVTVSDGAVRARYQHDEFAEQSVGGTLRSAAFSEVYGYGNLDGLGADRLVVVAPEGTHVGVTVPGGSLSDNRSRMVLTEYDRGGLVTFVPEDRTVGTLWGWLAVADLVWPAVAVNGLVGVVLTLAPARRFTYRRVLLGATIGAGIAVEASVVGVSLFYGRVPWTGIVSKLPALVVLFALVPAGFALGRERRRHAILTAAAGAAVATALTVPLARPVRTLGLGFRLVRSIAEAFTLAVVGLPFLIVGASLVVQQSA